MSDPTAIWSAVAAWGAVVAAFSSLAVTRMQVHLQRQSYLDSIRPEIVFDGWEFERDKFKGEIRIAKIRNFGHGPAQDVTLTATHPVPDGAHCFGNFQRIAVLPPGEDRQINASIRLLWPPFSVEPQDRDMYLWLCLTYKDLRGNEYSQGLFLSASTRERSQVLDDLVPGLAISGRDVGMTPPRTLRQRERDEKRNIKAYMAHAREQAKLISAPVDESDSRPAVTHSMPHVISKDEDALDHITLNNG